MDTGEDGQTCGTVVLNSGRVTCGTGESNFGGGGTVKGGGAEGGITRLTEGSHTISVDGGAGSGSGSVATDNTSTMTVSFTKPLYTVTVNSMTNGTVTSNLSRAAEGQTVMLTV